VGFSSIFPFPSHSTKKFRQIRSPNGGTLQKSYGGGCCAHQKSWGKLNAENKWEMPGHCTLARLGLEEEL